MSFGKRLKSALKYKKTTQTALADKLHTTPQSISQYVVGKRKPSEKMVKTIANNLGLEYAYTKSGEPYFFIDEANSLNQRDKQFNQEQHEDAVKDVLEDLEKFNEESNKKINQALKDLSTETTFLNYLLSLGYEYVNTFHTNDYGYDRCIHAIEDNVDIPLTPKEYENLKTNIKEDVDKEIRTLRRYKNL